MFHPPINPVLGKGGVNGGMTALPALPLQQSPQFARALTAFGSDVVSTAPVVLQRRIGTWGGIRFASRIRSDALTQAPRLINGEDDAPAAYRAAGYRQIMTPAHVAEWDLTQTDRRAAMQGKWRNRLVKGEAAGLRVRQTFWDGRPHWLFHQATAQARARRYRDYPFALLAAYAATNPKDSLMFEASAKGHPVAACLVVSHGTTATYMTAFSTPFGRDLQAPRVVLDHAAGHLTDSGHRIFDLGLVETDHTPGLARFKLGTGARLRALGGTWIRLGRRRVTG